MKSASMLKSEFGHTAGVADVLLKVWKAMYMRMKWKLANFNFTELENQNSDFQVGSLVM